MTEFYRITDRRKTVHGDSSDLTLPLSDEELCNDENFYESTLVTSTSFHICCVSVTFLFLGFGLICLSVWSLVFKNYYNHIIDTLELSGFTFSAAILCFPCFWIALSVHNHTTTHKYLPLMIVLIMISVILLIIATINGFTYKLRSNVELYGHSKVSDSIMLEIENELKKSMPNYDRQPKVRQAWDRIQKDLQCCGVNNYTDWLAIIEKLPDSCCKSEKCENQTTNFSGCLNIITHELVWQTNVFSGLTCVALSIQIYNLAVLAVIYFMKICKSIKTYRKIKRLIQLHH